MSSPPSNNNGSETPSLLPPNKTKVAAAATPSSCAAPQKRPNACITPLYSVSALRSNIISTDPPVTELMTAAKEAKKPKTGKPAPALAPTPTSEPIPAADADADAADVDAGAAIVVKEDNKGKEKKTFPTRGFDLRDGLGVYIARPETNPQGAIVEYDDEFVVIRDNYPKASVHMLLMPRNPAFYFQHPLKLLSSDAAFLAEVRTRAARLKKLAATELRRQYGRYSASDAPYQAMLEQVMSGPDPPALADCDALLPQGRDWMEDVVAGVHTHPSMNHLHVHIISREMHSPRVRHKKHYLSFNTSFMVGLDEFPLKKGSERFHPGYWPSWDMKCWRCGKNFGNQFAALKRHLEEEFEEWKRA